MTVFSLIFPLLKSFSKLSKLVNHRLLEKSIMKNPCVQLLIHYLVGQNNPVLPLGTEEINIRLKKTSF